MYLLSVIPIAHTMHTDMLDYYAKDFVDAGTIVTVPLRKQTVRALVVRSVPLRQAKGMVKTSQFAMRKITQVIGNSPLSSATMQGLQTAARYLATSVGVLIANSVPAEFIHYPSIASEVNSDKRSFNPRVLQAPLTERLAWYTAQSAKHKILIIAPTEELQKALATQMPTAVRIPDRLSPKKLDALTAKITQAMCIIGSPNAVGMIDMISPEMIVVEAESDNRYVRQKTPHIDIRIVAEHIARAHGVSFVLADSIVRVYTHARLAQGTCVQESLIFPHFSRTTFVSHVKDDTVQNEQRNPFFSEKLLQQLDAARHTIVFVPRKGLAPMVVCQDCGTQITCATCGLPMRLVQKKDSNGKRANFYACTHHDHTVPAYNSCQQCGGHRLTGLGVSTLRIRDELLDLFQKKERQNSAERDNKQPELLVLDQDEVPKIRDQQTIIRQFAESERSVLITTSLAFPYLDDLKPEIVLIPSLDMLLAQPDPEAHEAIIRIVSKFEEATTAPIFLQTRMPQTSLFSHMQSNTVQEWVANEIALRKNYQIPPFVTVLTIYARLTTKTIAQFRQNMDAFPAKPSNITVLAGTAKHGLLGKAVFRLPLSVWSDTHQNEQWHALIQSLPARYWAEISSNA